MKAKEAGEKLSILEKGWWENLWYYHKWLIILGGIIVLFVVIAVVQMFSKPDADVDLMFVGPWYLSSENKDELEESIRSIAEDYNGDGEKAVDILELTLKSLTMGEGGDQKTMYYDEYNSAMQRFQTELRAGDSVIYFLHKEFYETARDAGVLAPLSEVLPAGDLPGEAVDAYGLVLGSLDVYGLPGFSRMPADLILCMRRSPESDALQLGPKLEAWSGNKQAFAGMVGYRAPA